MFTHFNSYSTSVATWQQGLEKKNKKLTMFLAFQ